jgi:hypothetical protein
MGSENINPAYHRERQWQSLKSRKYILGVIEQYPNLWIYEEMNIMAGILKPPILKLAENIETKVT